MTTRINKDEDPMDVWPVVERSIEQAANVKEAIRLLGVYTAGRFDIWMLAGSPKASCRAHVMSVLLGVKTPQSKSGVTALREAFYQAGSIDGDCLAAKEENFLLWVRKETEDVSKSWKAGVKTSGDHDWVYNSLRFKTKEDAEAYVSDLATRWTAVQETHVEQSEEEPNR